MNESYTRSAAEVNADDVARLEAALAEARKHVEAAADMVSSKVPAAHLTLALHRMDLAIGGL